MGRQRLEAFSDGVFAILITIMVLEIKVPHGDGWGDLLGLMPILSAYALSFIFVGIYWNNHHHLLHTLEHSNGAIQWANLFLLFWISLIPVGVEWMDESGFANLPTALYSFVLFMCAMAYFVLYWTIRRSQGDQSKLAKAVRYPWKEQSSILLYIVAFGTSFWQPLVALGFLVVVAGLWLVPDRRIERAIADEIEQDA